MHVLANRLRSSRRPAERMKERWTADFSKPERSCFDIKPEIAHNAYLDKGSLFLGLRKRNCMAWLETENRVYVDQLIKAHLRFDGMGDYCAAGIMFRIIEGGTYYLALISSKGYFRVDVVTKNVPAPLIGWTEVSGLDGNGVSLCIVARGEHLIFLLNGRWVAEAWDSSVPGGHLGLALVSYDEADTEDPYPPPGLLSPGAQEGYACKAWLDFLSVDSRPAAVKAEYKKWCNSTEISAESRLRLAESYAALDRFDFAYDQILKAWQQREAAARSVMATYTEMRVRGELLLASRMACRLGQYDTAQEYIDACLAMRDDTSLEVLNDDEFDALSQKAIILSAQGKHAELVEFLVQRLNVKGDASSIAALYALLGHAYWNLQDHKDAAAAWDKAFSLNADNGLYAVCAANAYEQLGKNAQVLSLLLDAGNCFLRQQDNSELEALVPRLLAVGNRSWEAHALAGKWAFASGDFDRAETELALSDDLRLAARSKQEADPVACYLRGDLLNRQGKPSEAFAFFSEAVRLVPDYELYSLRLEETRSRLGDTPVEPKKKPAKATAKPPVAGKDKAAAKVDSAKVDTAKADPAKVEPVKTEPVKAEPTKAEPVKARKAPVKASGKAADKKPAPKAKPKQAVPTAKKTAAGSKAKVPGPAKKTPAKKTGKKTGSP